jgi:hypothetical protein
LLQQFMRDAGFLPGLVDPMDHQNQPCPVGLGMINGLSDRIEGIDSIRPDACYRRLSGRKRSVSGAALLDPRPPSFNVSCISGRIVFSVGTSPSTIAV